MSKTIIISAAADGIGWCITSLFLDQGYTVYASDIDQEKIDAINEHPLINNRLFFHNVDAGDANSVKNYFESLKLPRIDAIINNIGIAGPTQYLNNISINDWKKTIDTNLNTHFYFTKYAIPLIKKSKFGSVVNISSTAGIDGFPNRSPYAASKWALIGITKTLAMELGKFNIRVNAICPGSVKGSRMNRVIKAKAKILNQSIKSIEKDFVSMSSLKQWVYEEDIAKMCSFLISNDSLRVSGQVISVDGNTERMD